MNGTNMIAFVIGSLIVMTACFDVWFFLKAKEVRKLILETEVLRRQFIRALEREQFRRKD